MGRRPKYRLRTMITALPAVLWMLSPASLPGANTVVVESKSVGNGVSGVQVRIRIENDDTLRGIVLPLELRKVTLGAPQPFVTSIALSFGERLTGPALSEIVVMNQYENRNTFCFLNGCIGYDHPIIHTAEGQPVPVGGTPEGVMFVRMSIFSDPLLPGADVSGSMILTVNTSSDLGVFEIDTTCTWQCNNTAFIKQGPAPYEIIKPSFTKGTIEIVTCNCPSQGDLDASGVINATDLTLMINILFFNWINVYTINCPRAKADFNGDGFVNGVDLALCIDHIFLGGPGPVNPCLGL